MNVAELESDLRERYGTANSIIETSSATLPGWRLVWNYHSDSRGCGAANIERTIDNELPGVAIRLTDAGLRALDKKEGHRKDLEASSYRRYIETLRLASGTRLDAWVYVARPEKTNETPQWPSRAYRQLLIEGATENSLAETHILIR